MKTLKLFYVCAFCLMLAACQQDEVILPGADMTVGWRANNQPNKVTGDFEIEWKGNAGNHNNQTGMASRKGIVSFEAFAPTATKAPKGNFTFQVLQDDTLHRQIEANVYAVFVHPDLDKAWFLAEVIYDSKACAEHGGPGEGGHDDMGDCDDEEGGCDHDDGSDGHDAGCPGDDADHENVHISGKQCRVSQIVAVKAHDVATPGVDGDGITWKWFVADDQNLPDIDLVNNWPHLCKKTILSGNLVIH